MKTLLMMALSIAVSASAPAINTKKIKNERVLASSGAHYISIGSNGCAGDEDDCVIYRFVDAVTGETLKTFAGHLGDESSRFHTGAILLGLGDCRISVNGAAQFPGTGATRFRGWDPPRSCSDDATGLWPLAQAS